MAFSFKNDKILQLLIGDNIFVRIERVGFAIARLYFVDEGSAEIDIPDRLVVLDHSNGDAAVVAPVSVKGPFIVVFVFTAPIEISVIFVVSVLFPILMVGPTVPVVNVLIPVPIFIFPSPVPFDFVLAPVPIFNIPLDCEEHIPKFVVFATRLIVDVFSSGIALDGTV